jgi:F-type H+-transporting ATPase subunit b
MKALLGILGSALFALALTTASPAFAQAHGDHAPAPAPAPADPHAAAAPDHAATVPGDHVAPAGGGADHGGEHAAEHGEHGGHGPKPMNWVDFGNKEQAPYVSQLINFAVLLAIFYFVGKKPVMEGLKARRASVAKEIEEAQRMKKEADARAKMYQAKLDSLEEELATTKAALVEAGKGERDRIIKEAEEKAERMARDAKEQIVQEAKQMQQDLVRDTVEIAMAAAEELLRQKITPADHERLADEFLASLGKPAASISPPRGAS